MDITYHTEESMCTSENSLVLVHQNVRGIISKTEKLQEFCSNDKIYPHILCFSEHHMSRNDVCFVGIENSVLGSSFSRSTFQKGGVCISICTDVCFNHHFSKYRLSSLFQFLGYWQLFGRRLLPHCVGCLFQFFG